VVWHPLPRRAARQPQRAQRGAALPEYALAVAVIAVLLVGGINRLQASATSEISRRSGYGAPDLNEATTTAPFDPGVSTTAAPATTTTTTPASAATPALASSSTAKGSKWTMTVTVTLTDPGGAPLVGAKVTTSWNPGGNGTTTCTTLSPTGTCNVTQDQMKISDTPAATMTVVSVVGPSGQLTTTPATITSPAPS
jgi:Flp pilus assembly pilin Flp